MVSTVPVNWGICMESCKIKELAQANLYLKQCDVIDAMLQQSLERALPYTILYSDDGDIIRVFVQVVRGPEFCQRFFLA